MQENISICHGRTRKNTELRTSRRRLTRKEDTSCRAGCVSDSSFLRRRTQLFIAYLYKPQAQAKVLQIHVYYSHIIPSLALQACKTRNTVKSRFPNPQLIADKGAQAPSTSSGTGGLMPRVKQKVQMEELQWGFPIATTLSLKKLMSINGK